MGASKLAALCGQIQRHAARPAGSGIVSVLMTEIEKELVDIQAAFAAEQGPD